MTHVPESNVTDHEVLSFWTPDSWMEPTWLDTQIGTLDDLGVACV
jgi:hypothetical protein